MGALTQDEKDAIRDEAVAKWWKDWFAADYSWDGLADKPWQGWKVVENKTAYKEYLQTHGLPAGCPNEACKTVPADFEDLPKGTKTRDATLQDYWRDQADALEGQEGGTRYTIAHLPAQFEDGTESWKANPDHEKWEDLNRIVTERINRGIRTEIEIDFLGNETVTGADGRSHFRGCVLPALPAKASRADTQDEMAHALHITLKQAAILKAQNFNYTIFGSATNFSDAQFAGGNVDFSDAQFSGGNVDFWAAQFSGGDADFCGAQFSGGNAEFWNAQFSGGNANFRNAQFSSGNADFSGAQFSGGDASFSNAQFSGGNANFRGAQFSGGNANFRNAQFSSGNAIFWGAQFSGGDASFSNAQFSSVEATFNYSTFKEGINFANARFEKKATFINVTFPPARHSHQAFHSTDFITPVDFSRTVFIDSNGNPLPADSLNFPLNGFAHANFKDKIILTQAGEPYAQKEFDRAVKSITAACTDKGKGEIENKWVALESGCTTLKREMENVSDRNRAQRYFKFELLARQKRPSTTPVVRGFTKLYGLTAKYGRSIGRPILALICAWLIFTLGYLWNAWAVEVETAKPWHMVWGAMDFSATHIFRPLFIWSKNAASGDGSWAAQYHDQLSTGGWLTVKIFATLQSFLSITLLFLFGLATKRKFQLG